VAALDRSDLVLCPDPDGGYGLVGLRRSVPGLFDHPMSTRGVLDATLENAGRLGLRSRLMDPGFDIDEPSDLSRLASARAAGAAALCPRTLAYLDANGFWPAES
jgi:glycosyltransferase A (GT-A) superfamily protein (DUF2064 family)